MRSTKSLAKGLIFRIIAIIAVVLILFFCVVDIHKQDGDAMSPSIRNKDVVVVVRIFKSLPAQTVCLYKTPNGEVKLGRVIGVPDDVITYNEHGRLMVNNIESSEGYIIDADSEEAKNIAADAKAYKVPENSYYILNDRRSESGDSRTYGLIDKSDVLGQAFWQFRSGNF